MTQTMEQASSAPEARASGPGFLITLAICWIIFIIGSAVIYGLIHGDSYKAIAMDKRFLAPFQTWENPLGTDELGRDIVARLFASVRVSLLVAFGATIIAASFGTALGFLAAHYRGIVDHIVLILADFQAAMPFLILALAVLAFFGNSLTLMICLMGFYGWERYARISRSLAVSAANQGYASAVFQLGGSPRRVYLIHILPNIASTLIVSMTISFPEVILLESGLSFLGLGVQPPMTSLGSMVGFAREFITRAPWIILAPSFVIVATTLSVSLLGDWLRDKLDPTIDK